LDLAIGDKGLLWLLALFIEDTQVIPDFRFECIQGSSFNDVFECIAVVSILVVDYSESCPVSCLSWVFEGSLLKELKCFLAIIKLHVASSLNV
jgi:hypothetical protein